MHGKSLYRIIGMKVKFQKFTFSSWDEINYRKYTYFTTNY